MVADAALVHHYPPQMLSADAIGSALAVVTGQVGSGLQPRDRTARRAHAEEVVKVLRAVDSRSLNQRGAPLSDILSASNFMVERFEAASFPDNDQRESVLQLLRKRMGEGLLSPAVFRAVDSLPRPTRGELAKTLSGLPVFPAVALRVLGMVSAADVSFRDLAGLVSSDQVLAGHLLTAANSCLSSPTGRISTIRHAISYVGIEETRRVISAASVRPLFASSGVAELWKHSLETSRLSEELAAQSRRIQKDEAFLTGLVHDIGRLVTLRLSGEASQTLARLAERGCDRTFAEISLFGCDHGELGANVLDAWRFPKNLVDAVLHHHRAEGIENALASLLYLVECRTGCETPVEERGVRRALEQTGISPGWLEGVQPDIGVLWSMCFAA